MIFLLGAFAQLLGLLKAWIVEQWQWYVHSRIYLWRLKRKP